MMMHLLFLLLFAPGEKLDRGLIAIPQSPTQTFLSWRLLDTDPSAITFNIYRQTDGQLQKLSSQSVTNYVDNHADIHHTHTYLVKSVIGGKETNTATYTIQADAPIQQYLTIPLKTPPGYTPNDASAADLDGDGQYEIILHQTGRGKDNSQSGITDPPIFQAYKLDGTFLWEINLGRNIREGAHYTQFMVYDLDGDSIAEFACKTADGTIDGKGKVIGDSTKDYRDLDPTSKSFGRILTGPEYFTIFSGKTGEALATTDYIPGRGDIGGWGGYGGNGGTDHYGNRVDRFLACVAYLDGKRPSVVMCRGYYGRIVLAAWDFQDGKLTSRWVFDTKDGRSPYSGMGNHNLSVADVDNDGKDEIIYGSMCVDDDGKGLYTTGLRHGDALHVGDLDPDHPGLEVFGIHELENGAKGTGAALYDARTGQILFRGSIDQDVGRGVAENIDSTRKGAQLWWSGSKGLYDTKGNRIGDAPRSTNFLIWWDGDLSRELLDGNHIDKYGRGTIFTAEGCVANNGTKATPTLTADLFGDWREELVMRTSDNQSLRIYTTTIPTTHRIITLMQDHQYRMSIIWQNVGYNQPPHTGFYPGKF
ncbi:rhamnogalacturonan lyase [Chitinophaga sp. LS1]|uniref:rhamnogalacturonan lyase n=1 Tax=Chitinophaga sp. LS1 TaxID=3051176 RepID=UPI002AAC4A7B|nr:rhamnogalacturonan lyase [Chitinophaga sp. LS1]WPV69613.1 rhamnogalacturonan lyase [Chitinophaga sp. LS1]